MNGRAVFVVMNKATLAVFLNENVDNVLATVQLDKINPPLRPK